MPTPHHPETVERLYRALRRIRRVEEEIARIYPSDRIKSPVHLSIGQEAIAVGVCDALTPDDAVSITYRGHAAYLAHGGDLKAMMAELFGKATGCAGGKGGSMHLVDRARNVLGASAVVGTTIPIAVGVALAYRRRRERRVVAAFFGDGATEEGAFHESLNFAALHRLPILFVCENNGLAIHEPLAKRWSSARLVDRVAAYGAPARCIDGADVFAVRAAVEEAMPGLRSGAGGPVFLECATYRWREHVGPGEDYDAGYRLRAELEKWQARDAVVALAAMVPDARRRDIDDRIEIEIAQAIDFAERSPFPAPEALHADVFAA